MRRALAVIALLLTTAVHAEPVVIGPDSPVKSVSDTDWRRIYDAARTRADALIREHGDVYRVGQVPLTTAESQCLLNRLTRGEGNGLLDIVRKVGNHPLVQRLGGADKIALVVAAINHALGGTGGDDWCNQDGPLGRNRGLSLYGESVAFSVPDARLGDAVDVALPGLKGQPITWPQAVAIALAALAGAASLAVP